MKQGIIFLLLINLFSCGVKTSDPPGGNDSHNSRNSVDWAGLYSGMLPCADCTGIDIVIRLNKDETFSMQKRYSDKSSEIFNSSGTFSWNANGNIIQLKSPDGNISYRVGENNITQLDEKGNIISGGLADQYILTKRDDIREIYWRLTGLGGKALDPSVGKEIHFVLKERENRVIGNGGCNSFNGTYKISPDSQIRFSSVASTKMACDALDIEGKFFKMMEMVDNYSLQNDTLYLKNAGMAHLAKFQAIHFR